MLKATSCKLYNALVEEIPHELPRCLRALRSSIPLLGLMILRMPVAQEGNYFITGRHYRGKALVATAFPTTL